MSFTDFVIIVNDNNYMKKQKILYSIFIVLAVIILVFIYVLNNDMKLTSNKPSVAATIFPLADITREISGDSIDVLQILPSGSSPHTFDLTPERVKHLQNASIIFKIGHNLDDWIDNLSDSVSNVNIQIVDSNINIKTNTNNESEEHHVHDSTDPHYWLSISNAKIIANNISDSLSQLYPDNASIFSANLSNYLLELDQLKTRLDSKIEILSNKELVTFHSAWYYFAEDFDLDVIATFEPFAGQEPSPKYLVDFQDTINKHKVTTVFSEPQLSNESLLPFIKDLGLSLVILDPLGGFENRQSYTQLIEYNVDNIIQALN